MFKKLCEAQLYLSWDKVDLYSQRMDCLSHIISDAGIHACMDKMQKIWGWRQPRSYHDVQRFLGLVQYLAHFLPDITTYMSPISTCVQNGRPFVWTLLLDKCFESILKHSLARLQYWSLLMQVTQSLSGLYAMAPRLELGPCMDKARTGNPAVQQASYQRSSVMHSRTIILMSMRWSLSSKHLLLLFANNFGTLIYVVFLACIFVELFLNKECTYLDNFWF